jgi:hypothetical protein
MPLPYPFLRATDETPQYRSIYLSQSATNKIGVKGTAPVETTVVVSTGKGKYPSRRKSPSLLI